MPDYPTINPFAYWDDDMDRQLAEYATGATAFDPLAETLKAQDVAAKTLGPEAGNAFGEGVLDHYQGTGPGYRGPMQPPAPEKEPDLSPRVAMMMKARDAATNALGQAGGDAFGEGVMNHVQGVGSESGPFGGSGPGPYKMVASAAPRGRAYIAQATGPIGTIGQIGEELPLGAIDIPLSVEEAQQIEIDRPANVLSPEEEAQIEIDPIGASVRDGLGLGEPDAISGGSLPGQDHLGPGQTSGVPRMPDEYLTGDELGDAMAGRSLDERAQFQQDVEGRRQDFMTTEVLKARAAADQAKREAAQRYEMRLKDGERRQRLLDERARQLANEKIDPLKDIGTGTKIAGVLAAFIGGFAANQNGGRNVGLEAIDDLINRSIQTQTANLAHQKDMLGKERNAIAEEMANGATLQEAQTAVALATYDSAMTKLQTDLQSFDPRGSQALQRMKTIEQLAALRQQAAEKARLEEQKLAQQDFENALKLADHGLKEDELALKRHAQQAKLGAAGTAKPVKPDDVVQPPEYFEGLYGKRPPIPMSQNGFEQWTKTGKVTQDLISAERANSPDERNRQLSVGELVDTEGKPLQFRSPESAEKVGTQKAAGDFMVQILDRLDTAYQKHGWSSDLLKSPEWQEAQADLSQYILEKKNLDQLGVLAGPDLDLIKGSWGKLDVTGIRDPGPGLRRARANTIEKVNSTVRAQVAGGQKPKRWEPPSPPSAPPKTPEDRALMDLKAHDPMKMPMGQLFAELGVDSSAGVPFTLRMQQVRDKLEQNGGLVPSVRARIDHLAKISTSLKAPASERERAHAELTKLSQEAEYGPIREAAAAALSPPAQVGRLGAEVK